MVDPALVGESGCGKTATARRPAVRLLLPSALPHAVDVCRAAARLREGRARWEVANDVTVAIARSDINYIFPVVSSNRSKFTDTAVADSMPRGRILRSVGGTAPFPTCFHQAVLVAIRVAGSVPLDNCAFVDT
jgi:hypothetical protein